MATAAGARPREGTPPPIIGRAGRYTVFITPPATPRTPTQGPRPLTTHASPSPSPSPRPSPISTPKSAAVPTPTAKAAPPSPVAPPVQVPPPQFDKPSSRSSNSSFGFFWDAVAKVQDAHSRLDEYLADWFGLNQSKYQWALNDYYESKGMDKEAGKTKELVSKSQNV
ncbi:hypothetical protein Taro_020702 [Colocasia esculenta]|uniref:Uncharacterized protein n=1 Tax=Colocasia esculenta TaxID=4460 RepID=A0A843V613_COLES|nr:hypothetical protein [Colocasia esculenta]